tara:strand:+ start:405 stop:923 length:519 start_codon:yes stop_codon:yes gene_type:complete
MPILCLHYKNFNTNAIGGEDSDYASQRLKMSAGSLPVQKLVLCGYAVNIRKHDTLQAGSEHKIPDHLVVELDQISTSQINVASPPVQKDSENYTHSHGIPLPLSDSLNTIQMGMAPLEFDVNKKLNRIMKVNIKYYNDNNELVPMTTTTNNTGQVAIEHLLLYFQYDFAGNF